MTFINEFKLIEEELKSYGVMILATTDNIKVSARSMCTIYEDGHIYFQTDKKLEKCKQIEINNNVALTVGFIQVEGVATIIGKWDEHPKLLNNYCKMHRKSYETYKDLSTEVVVKVEVARLKKWSYIDGTPYQLELLVKDKAINVVPGT